MTANETGGNENPNGSGDGTEFPLEARRLARLVPNCAIYVLDPDGYVTVWGEAASRLVGYSESEAVGNHYGQFFPESAREQGRPDRLLGEAARAGRIDDEGWRRKRDGSWYRAREILAEVRDEEGTITGFVVVTHDVTVDHERAEALRTENAVIESILDAQSDILYAFDLDDTLLHWNDRFASVTGYGPDELVDLGPLAFIAPEDRERVGAAIDWVLEEGGRITVEGTLLTKSEERIPYEFNSARISDESGDVLGFVGIGRDVSERKARERALERVDRLNGVIRTIHDELVDAETRRELEATVVDTFVAADSIAGAVVGTYDSADGFDPRIQAGGDVPADAGLLPAPAEASVDGPLAQAGEREVVAARRHLHEDPIDEWRAVADEYDYRAVVAIPFVAERRVAGVLGLYATVPEAFGEREREVLQEFGGTIGHAINAMEVRRLLYADTVVELEFEATDRGDACIDLSREGDCRLSIDHLLPLTDEVFVYYLTASGIEVDRLRELASTRPEVHELRCIEPDPAIHRWEFEIHGSTIAAFLTEYGARVRSQEIDSGAATLVVEVSPDTAVRELFDALQSAYPQTDLIAKRTVERPRDTGNDFGSTVEPDLTEKQRTALEAAYYGGYFEWPSRNSDASDIADRLGVARQTFHQHLRVAEAKLLEAYLEDDA